MLPAFCSETVIVLRAPLAEGRGTATRDWAAAESREVNGCMVAFGPTSTAFDSDRELPVSEGATLYAPPGTDLREGDRVECRLGAFEVDGAPQEFSVPGVAIGHVRAGLARWEG